MRLANRTERHVGARRAQDGALSKLMTGAGGGREYPSTAPIRVGGPTVA
jgi:hypothetical protein